MADSDRAEIARLWAAGWSQGQIAVKMGMAQQSVHASLRKWHGARYAQAKAEHEAHRRGVGEQVRRERCDPRLAAVDMFKQGMACSEIAAVQHVPSETVRAWIVDWWREMADKAERAAEKRAMARAEMDAGAEEGE